MTASCTGQTNCEPSLLMAFEFWNKHKTNHTACNIISKRSPGPLAEAMVNLNWMLTPGWWIVILANTLLSKMLIELKLPIDIVGLTISYRE